MAAEAEMVLLEAARRRDEGEILSPLVSGDGLSPDQILAECPALTGAALVKPDGGSQAAGMPAASLLVAMGLSAIGDALGTSSGIVAYIGQGQRLLLRRGATGHMLLAAVRQGEGLGEASAQIERVFTSVMQPGAC
jgi:hypothetical protein